MLKKAMLFFLIMFAISACSKSAESPTPTAAATPIPATNEPSLTFPTIPPLTPASSTSPTPFITFSVKPAVDNLKLRVNPGYLFDAIRMVHTADTLTVLGKAPGGEWTYVQAADGTEGWVFTVLLASSVDLKQVPVREPKDVQLIKGRALDVNDTPIPGVVFNIAQGAGQNAPNNTASTDANGDFYCYIPLNSTGAWTVTYTAIACESIVWSDKTCTTYKSGYTGTVTPQSLTANLPQISPLVFTWR